MNVHDEISDSEALRAASKSLSAMPMASPRPWRRSWPGAAFTADAGSPRSRAWGRPLWLPHWH